MRHMKKEKKSHFGATTLVILALIVLISGYHFFYPNHVEQPKTTDSVIKKSTDTNVEEGSSKTKKSSKNIATKKDDMLWNKKKDAKLSNFIADWQTTMNQSYVGTYQSSTVNFEGVSFPEYLTDGQVSVNQQKVRMKWTTKESSNVDYQVVAVYAGDQYLYLFTFHQGSPEVLVTSQASNEGTNFKVTENTQLISEFQQLANEK